MPDFEPTPWTADVPMDVVGQCVPRQDALEKITGRATYTADVRRPGMLCAAIVRSPVAHGRVKTIDLTPSLAIPGVRAVLLREEVDGLRYDSGQLFDHVVRFAGQPLAAVAAETQDLANRAALAAIVQVEAEGHAVTAEAALRPNAPRIRSHGNASKNSPRV